MDPHRNYNHGPPHPQHPNVHNNYNNGQLIPMYQPPMPHQYMFAPNGFLVGMHPSFPPPGFGRPSLLPPPYNGRHMVPSSSNDVADDSYSAAHPYSRPTSSAMSYDERLPTIKVAELFGIITDVIRQNDGISLDILYDQVTERVSGVGKRLPSYMEKDWESVIRRNVEMDKIPATFQNYCLFIRPDVLQIREITTNEEENNLEAPLPLPRTIIPNEAGPSNSHPTHVINEDMPSSVHGITYPTWSLGDNTTRLPQSDTQTSGHNVGLDREENDESVNEPPPVATNNIDSLAVNMGSLSVSAEENEEKRNLQASSSDVFVEKSSEFVDKSVEENMMKDKCKDECEPDDKSSSNDIFNVDDAKAPISERRVLFVEELTKAELDIVSDAKKRALEVWGNKVRNLPDLLYALKLFWNEKGPIPSTSFHGCMDRFVSGNGPDAAFDWNSFGITEMDAISLKLFDFYKKDDEHFMLAPHLIIRCVMHYEMDEVSSDIYRHLLSIKESGTKEDHTVKRIAEAINNANLGNINYVSKEQPVRIALLEHPEIFIHNTTDETVYLTENNSFFVILDVPRPV